MNAAERGDSTSADALFSARCSELRRLAKRELARQGLPISLGATTLLHQAYIEIAEKKRSIVTGSRAIHGVCCASDAGTDR
jgi:ECF sigma factor